jgi:predicted metal-dependent hydrolase
MPEFLKLGEIVMELEYRRIKRLRITVYPPDGRVKIAAPLHTSPDYIRNFALSKLAWIEKHRTRFSVRAGRSGAFERGGKVWVWGRPLVLEIVEEKGTPGISIAGDRLILRLRPGAAREKGRELLEKWYRGMLKKAAPPLIKKWEPLLGVSVTAVFVRKMKTHWGSCNQGRQTIRLNSELAKKDPLCLDYVILHEMIHIVETGHNRNFYRILNRLMPDWKVIRKKMNRGEL